MGLGCSYCGHDVALRIVNLVAGDRVVSGRDLDLGYQRAMQGSRICSMRPLPRSSKKEDFICPNNKSRTTRLRISSEIFWHRIACM